MSGSSRCAIDITLYQYIHVWVTHSHVTRYQYIHVWVTHSHVSVSFD